MCLSLSVCTFDDKTSRMLSEALLGTKDINYQITSESACFNRNTLNKRLQPHFVMLDEVLVQEGERAAMS